MKRWIIAAGLISACIPASLAHADNLTAPPTVDPDPIQENFGARVSPYGGFLELPANSVPPGYVETSHHFTKHEYVLKLTKTVDGNKFNLDLTESDVAQFFEPKDPPFKEFTYQGRTGRIFTSHGTGKPALSLYWMNAPKQRLSISVQQVQSDEWSPDRLIRLLEAMRPVDGEPPLIKPSMH
ncbi:MAG: hypothetical protein K2W78_05035 [Xanthobacteraceae bacterium]|nr:hypothetical protein [Xanthobacteraceae bacterium]